MALMIALHIFDMGGVVSLDTDLSGRIAGRLGLSETRIREIAREESLRLMKGLITVTEFWRRFSELTGREVQEDLWAALFRPRPNLPVVELVKELTQRGRVVVGTNTFSSHYRIHEQNGDYAIFDAVYASHRMGLAKPDPAFYTHILHAEGVRPEQAVFIDDMEANVEAARELGVRALLFDNAEQLRRELAALQGDTAR